MIFTIELKIVCLHFVVCVHTKSIRSFSQEYMVEWGLLVRSRCDSVKAIIAQFLPEGKATSMFCFRCQHFKENIQTIFSLLILIFHKQNTLLASVKSICWNMQQFYQAWAFNNTNCRFTCEVRSGKLYTFIFILLNSIRFNLNFLNKNAIKLHIHKSVYDETVTNEFPRIENG